MGLELLLAGGAAYGGYRYTKKFVIKKLRFVPRARKRAAPWLAGAGAVLLVAPLAAILPIIGGLTAAAFGAGVAGGIVAGDRELDKTDVWGDRRR
jgi:hypothetical protein